MADFTDIVEAPLVPVSIAHSAAGAGDHTNIIELNIIEGPLPPPPPVPDTTPPVVSGFDPAPGTQIARNQTIQFDVTDDSGAFARIFVVAFFKLTGIQEVIHDGIGFVGFYSATSTRVVITNGFRYIVLRSGGWIEAPTIRVFPIDSSGNE